VYDRDAPEESKIAPSALRRVRSAYGGGLRVRL